MDSEISIEPIINKKIYGFAVQAKKFSFDIKVTNNSIKPSPEFDIIEITLSNSQGQDFSDDFGNRSFFIEKLNPGENKIIKIGKNGQFTYGLVNIEIKAKAKDSTVDIIFLQKSPFTGETCKCEGKNRWIDFFYIKSLNEYEQERTNIIMIILTFIIAILTIMLAVPIIEDFMKFLKLI